MLTLRSPGQVLRTHLLSLGIVMGPCVHDSTHRTEIGLQLRCKFVSKMDEASIESSHTSGPFYATGARGTAKR